MAYSAFAIAFFVLNQGVMLQGAAKVVAVATGDGLSPNTIVLAMAGAFLSVIISFGLYYVLNVLDTGRLTLVYKWKPEPFGLAWVMVIVLIVLAWGIMHLG